MCRLLLLLVLVCLPGSGRAVLAAAAEMPVCEAATAGVVACIADRLCRCDRERGDSFSGATGHRWDCGILRPYCRPPDSRREPRYRLGDPADITVPLFITPPPKPDRRPLRPGRRSHSPAFN